eukprot:snap_masked-scaffold_2-processed-gene-4.10-mRNA-1 protein AED:1.00 eAED:1.00 QI:0/0/0/0/1/1/2/0/62
MKFQCSASTNDKGFDVFHCPLFVLSRSSRISQYFSFLMAVALALELCTFMLGNLINVKKTVF